MKTYEYVRESDCTTFTFKTLNSAIAKAVGSLAIAVITEKIGE